MFYADLPPSHGQPSTLLLGLHMFYTPQLSQASSPCCSRSQIKVVADATASFSVPGFTVPAGKTVDFKFTITAPASLPCAPQHLHAMLSLRVRRARHQVVPQMF